MLQLGTEFDLEHSTTLYSDGLESTSLSLRFKTKEKHFASTGSMTVKCRSQILGVYRIENEAQLIIYNSVDKQQQSSGFSENLSQGLFTITLHYSVLWFSRLDTQFLRANVVIKYFSSDIKF